MRLSEVAIWLCAVFLGVAALCGFAAKEEASHFHWRAGDYVSRYLALESARYSAAWADLAECHRRVDLMIEVVRAIEARRGNEAPRLLDEARYRGKPDPVPFVPGEGELSR